MSRNLGRSISRGVLRLLLALAALALGALIASADPAAPKKPAPAPPSAAPKTDATNGFALTRLAVARDSIVAGGPARDAIRAVDSPTFAPLQAATWVRGDTPVIGVVVGDDARAYPVHIMEYHQVVNDVIGGKPVVVTYDPLTDTALAYHAHRAAAPMRFGVSGLLYNSNFLLYDHSTESLWSQFLGRALTGKAMGEQLESIRVRVASMARWVEAQPGTKVLERPAVYEIDYRYSVYTAYWTSEEVPFPVLASDSRFHPKEVVLGVASGDQSRAYLGSILTRAGGRIVDDFAGSKLRIEYDGETGTFNFEAPDALRVVSAYWFAWKAFHPATSVWQETEPTP